MVKFDKIKILGIIITYYPNIEETKRNIEQFIENIDLLIIWENTPLEERAQYKIELEGYKDKIIYKGTDVNTYIAYPLNQAVIYGKENGFTHILTMDQDSYFESGHFVKFKEIACKNANDLSIYGPNPNYSDEIKTAMPQKKTILITSGNIINIKTFDLIGLYREDYGIDCIDHELCYRAHQYGIDCIMIGSILMRQTFGKIIRTRKGFYTSNYPPSRLFYIARNNIYLYRDYPQYGFNNILTYIFKPIIKIILSEDNKGEKIVMILKGVIKGLFNR